ncbi:MAG: terpene cyclase/mutase family protein [Planctomycetes bacterium]|nr:terpene cyclase/mutase family protein [Planctomycetota bacterium]
MRPRLLPAAALLAILSVAPAFQAAVDGAIARGVAWLRRRQLPDGGFDIRPLPMFHVEGQGSLGPPALALYTLRACGAPREDPDVRRGFQRLRERYDSLRKQRQGLDNYGVSLAILALEAHYAAEEDPGAKDRYGASPAARRMPEADLDWMRELTRWLLEAQVKRGGFSYWSPAQGSSYDHSNSQFSLLALKAASRSGVEIPKAAWRRALEHFLDTQEDRGPPAGRFEPEGGGEGYGSRLREVAKDEARGWGYVNRAPATGSMTAGGVSSLVICRSELLGTSGYPAALDLKAVKGIRDGLAWLGLRFDLEQNPGPPGAQALRELWHYYWLYGLERAGVLSGATFLGRHDWYLEGATFLLDGQRDDGSWLGQAALDAVPWKGAGPDPSTANFLDTCFALLFLKRATFRVDRGAVATEAGADALDLGGAADLDEAAFGNLFDAVFHRYRRAAPADAAARAGDFVRLGTRALPLLVLRLDAAEEEERAAAFEILRRTTGATLGYDPAAPAEARAAAVAAWEEWWFANRARLKADPGAGRFL